MLKKSQTSASAAEHLAQHHNRDSTAAIQVSNLLDGGTLHAQHSTHVMGLSEQPEDGWRGLFILWLGLKLLSMPLQHDTSSSTTSNDGNMKHLRH